MIFSLPSIAKAFFFSVHLLAVLHKRFPLSCCLYSLFNLRFLNLDLSISFDCCPRILIHLTSASSFGIEK